MKTRSQTRIVEESVGKYTVEIDVDGAREAWRANKKELPNCCYQYICGQVLITGKKCNRKPCKDNERCALHMKKVVRF